MVEIISCQNLISVLFIFIFCINLNSAQLICWKCDSCPEPFDNSSSSVSYVTCTSSQTICVKNTIRVLNRSPQITKGCVETCTPSSSNFFGQGAFVDCCNTNYCNFSTRNQISMFFITLFTIICFYHKFI